MKARTVLFVDDEINILASLKRGLLDEKYRKLFAQSGAEALKIMESEPVHIIVTDMRMPEMDGLKLLKIVKEKHPKIVKMVLSGYTQLPQILTTINQVDIFKFITKPWSMDEELIPIIRQAIDYYNLEEEKAELKDSLEKKNQMYQNVLRSINDRIANQEKEIKSIEELHKYSFSKMVDIVKNSKLEMEEKSKLIKASELYSKVNHYYIKSLPISTVEIDIENFFTESRNMFKKYLEQDMIKCDTELKDQKVNGYHSLYKNMAELIIESLHYREINFDLEVLINQDKHLLYNLNLTVTNTNADEILNYVREIESLLNIVFNAYQGNITYKGENSKLKIQLNFELRSN